MQVTIGYEKKTREENAVYLFGKKETDLRRENASKSHNNDETEAESTKARSDVRARPKGISDALDDWRRKNQSGR